MLAGDATQRERADPQKPTTEIDGEPALNYGEAVRAEYARPQRYRLWPNSTSLENKQPYRTKINIYARPLNRETWPSLNARRPSTRRRRSPFCLDLVEVLRTTQSEPLDAAD